MTYDQWKCTDPREYEPDECYHEDYEIGYDGLARCDCGETWWPSDDEVRSQRERIAAYDAYLRREERLDRYWRPLWRCWFRLLARIWPRKPKPIDDELPF